jgi:hypothetical protein
MATVPVVETPPPAGVLAVVGLLDAGDRINLDVDDLDVDVRIDGLASTAWRHRADDLAIEVVGSATVVGVVDVAVTITSDELGIGDGVTVALAVAVDEVRYGATVAGVEALVTDLTVTYATNPSVADVRGWLGDIAGRVAARVGDLDELGDEWGPLLTTRARGLVHLGAAAYTEDAAHPERIRAQGDARYGAILWARYVEGLDALAVEADRVRGAEELDPLAGRERPGYSFPEPTATIGRLT